MIPSMERDERDRQFIAKATKRSSSSNGNKLLKFLPRAATSAISFQNPPFSPGRSSDNNGHNHSSNNTHHHRSQSHVGKGFSGPLMVSIIPDEARRRSKNGDGLGFGAAEPGSPKVSCMGQIKHKKKMKKKEKEEKVKAKQKEKEKKTQLDKSFSRRHSPLKKPESAIRRIFGGGKQKKAEEKPVDKSVDASPELVRMADRGAPGLGQMRRFASGREAFAGFDWSEVQVAPVESEARRDHCDADDEEEEEEEEVMIPFSAPIPLGGGGGGVDVRGGGAGGRGTDTQPRKEINLWKRRTMAPPRPLQLHPSGGGKH